MPAVFDYYGIAATGFGEAWVLARSTVTTDVAQAGPSAAGTFVASVFHTQDGGKTWSADYRSDAALLNSITITDDGRGWIVGNQGLLLFLQRTSKQTTPYAGAEFHADALAEPASPAAQ